MISGSFRRAGVSALNVGRTVMSRRMANEGKRAAAISVCLAHKMSTTAISHSIAVHTDLALGRCCNVLVNI